MTTLPAPHLRLVQRVRGACVVLATLVGSVVGAVASGCAEQHEVIPQIRVVPGAAARARWIGGGVHGIPSTRVEHDDSPCSSSSSSPPAPARVGVLEAGARLGGSSATGKPGDLVLE